FFLHRLPGFPAVGIFRWRGHEGRELVLVLDSQKADMLEVGLKDAAGGEEKIVLRVRSGWTGYRIRLSDFRNVNVADLDQVILAHSRTVGSASTNTFRIAALVIR